MNVLHFISDWINQNPGKAVGAFVGFFLGILLLTIGFIKTIIIILLILVGYVIGKSSDENKSLLDIITGLFKRR